jgi:hypothetical protein
MLQRICLVLSVCALAFFLVGGLSQAGWSGLGLTSAHDASSLVISVKKHKHHNDDEDDAGDDNSLEQCTIQKPGSGMGCAAPLKLKCEKMKNGQKCCGCVGDKNAKTQQPPEKTAQPQTKTQKSSCMMLVKSQKMIEVYENDCKTKHPGGFAGCEIPNDTQYRCCCNWTE